MTMASLWARKRMHRETQQRVEEQMDNVNGQLIKVGEIIGRLSAVASQLEVAATRLIGTIDDNEEHLGEHNGNREG
jgi:hypothetical protein